MAERRILVVAHAHRDDTVDAAVRVVDTLRRAGATPVMELADRTALAELAPVLGDVAVLGDDIRVDDLDLAIVLGGDGTILRAAELVREGTAPVLGINMGHVGFLAEIERDNMDAAVARAVAGDYEVEERLALAVKVRDGAGRIVFESFALNEASIEKDSPGRMIDVVLEVDRRPLSSFGADGVVIATPTGSTAYGFSPAAPSCGRLCRRSPWCRCRPTRCSPAPSWSGRSTPSRSSCRTRWEAQACCGATVAAHTRCRTGPGCRSDARRSR